MEAVKNRIFFSDLTFNSEYEFLEEAKDKSELMEIAQRRGLRLPSPDLAVFRCVYALCDSPNLNGCILPCDEVSKALDSLIGKLIDVDHERNRAIGHWIDKKQVDGKIIAYGALWKSAFTEEYKHAKLLMDQKKLRVSFEAWGDHEPVTKNTYNLNRIHFAGGAILLKTKPAFPEAKVLEFSSVVKNTLNTGKTETLVKCQYCNHEFDWDGVLEFKGDAKKCPKCFAIIDSTGKVIQIPQIIDFSINCPSCKGSIEITKRGEDTAEVKCVNCAREYEITFELADKANSTSLLDVIDTRKASCPQCGNAVSFGLFFSEKEIDLHCKHCGLNFPYKAEYRVAKKIVKKIVEKQKSKEEAQFNCSCVKCGYKMSSESHCKDIKCPKCGGTMRRAERPGPGQSSKSNEGGNKMSEEKKVEKAEEIQEEKKVEEVTPEEKVEQPEKKEEEKVEPEKKEEDAPAPEATPEKTEEKPEESALEKRLQEAEAKIKDLEGKLEEAKKSLDKVKEDTKLVTERRIGLGEKFSEGLSDEDLLDDIRYENAVLKKKLAEKEIEKSNKNDLVVGTNNKTDNSWETQKKITENAFPEENS